MEQQEENPILQTGQTDTEAMQTEEMTQTKESIQTEDKENRTKDRTLHELCAGIVLWGLICEIIGVWFVADKTGYSLGLATGTLLGVLAGIHMWWAIDRALDFSESAASKMIVKHSMIRYLVIVAALALVMVSGFANPLSAFLGLMGLKVSAYLQPFTHRVCSYFYKKKDI